MAFKGNIYGPAVGLFLFCRFGLEAVNLCVRPAEPLAPAELRQRVAGAIRTC